MEAPAKLPHTPPRPEKDARGQAQKKERLAKALRRNLLRRKVAAGDTE